MLGPDLVNEILTVFRHVGELAATALPHVITSGAQPNSFVFKVLALLGVEVSTVQIMLPPMVVISLPGARGVAEAQTGLCPPEILLRAMDLLQHDGLRELAK